MSRPFSLEEFTDCGSHQQGHFLLSSGLHSGDYLQCALYLAHPKRAARAGELLAEGVDAIVGPASSNVALSQLSTVVQPATGEELYNGAPKEEGNFYQVGHFSKIIVDGEEVESIEGLNPVSFLAVIEDSEIEHSVVLEKSQIKDIGTRIQDSLIGRDVTISRSPIKPKALKLTLADHSKVGIL